MSGLLGTFPFQAAMARSIVAQKCQATINGKRAPNNSAIDLTSGDTKGTPQVMPSIVDTIAKYNVQDIIKLIADLPDRSRKGSIDISAFHNNIVSNAANIMPISGKRNIAIINNCEFS
jgi:hypothetical protein